MHSKSAVLVSVMALLLLISPALRSAQVPWYFKVTVQGAKLMIDSDPSLMVLDVRTRNQYDSGHLRNARLIPENELVGRIGELDKSRPILVYCQIRESDISCQTLVSYGFQHVYAVINGMTAWTEAGYPIYASYSSLQEVINDASTGDVIRVAAGTYYETLTIPKPITLEGENKTTTIINNNHTSYNTIIVETDNISVTDFTIRNGWNAIFCPSPSLANLTIQNDIIENNTVAGISLTGPRHSIVGNIITKNGLGIKLESAQDTLITRNTLTNNTQTAVELRNSVRNRIIGNSLANDSVGVRFYAQSSGNVVTKNGIVSCMIGISVHDSSGNVFSSNLIEDSTSLGMSFLRSDGNTIYHNNIMNSSLQLENVNSTNRWDNGFLEGNFWSDYNGTDMNGDGIGDTELAWQNVDEYPLINAYTDGDYNHDAIVNSLDVDLLNASWQTRFADADYNPHVDFNMDSIIDIKDAAIVGVNWLKESQH